ncbi:glutamate ligase domain-containing protein [Paractinoplanes durhamensis]|uniref:glutamate ligase domain-containing protein n=1 Tax=Paractinoplanes durhamensis TaxID=113563 RepID=UPI00364508C9
MAVFVDYAHNPAALAATLRTLHRLWGAERCVAAVTLPGDRRDDLLAACAQIVADGVGRAVLYDDEDLRGREPGEVSALVEREMRARRPKLMSMREDGYREAITSAVRLARPGRSCWCSTSGSRRCCRCCPSWARCGAGTCRCRPGCHCRRCRRRARCRHPRETW